MIELAKQLRHGNLVTIDNPAAWAAMKDIPLMVTGVSPTTDIDEERTKTFCVHLEPIGGMTKENCLKYKMWTPFSQLVRFVKPILITEDSVKDLLGFELVEDLGDMKYYQLPNIDKGYGVLFDHDNIVFYEYKTNDGYSPILYDEPHFQFIHHLQNLLADLTGK